MSTVGATEGGRQEDGGVSRGTVVPRGTVTDLLLLEDNKLAAQRLG